jgi:RNA polymerase sigma-70 factor (ECF subfamily)
LKGHLLARGADSDTAEEIVQEVMLTVWRKAQQFDATRGSPSAWIFTLTRNAFIDRVRREYRPEVDPSDPVLDANDPGADRLVADAESQRELAAAVESLPPEQQHVVKRSYFHGQSLAEISAADRLPLGTVKTRARLALSRLRALVTQPRET